MVLAELNAFVSRPIAPTRRIALGDVHLECVHPPDTGGVLLAAVIAEFSRRLDDETHSGLVDLMKRIAADQRVPQPMMRHRFQTDRVGLQHITYRLSSHEDRLVLRFPPEDATPAQHVLVAVYAAATIDPVPRRDVISFMERALSYSGSTHDDLVRFLSGGRGAGRLALADPIRWALDVLSLDVIDPTSGRDAVSAGVPTVDAVATAGRGRGRTTDGPSAAGSPADAPHELPRGLQRMPTRSEIQRAFRQQLHLTHPDHGAESAGAAGRIAELAEARRILLDS